MVVNSTSSLMQASARVLWSHTYGVSSLPGRKLTFREKTTKKKKKKKKGEKVHHTYIVNIRCTCNSWPGALIDTIPLYIRPPVPILHDIIVRPLSPAHVLNPSRTRHCEPERKETKKKKKKLSLGLTVVPSTDV